jgi:hypothetical protein
MEAGGGVAAAGGVQVQGSLSIGGVGSPCRIEGKSSPVAVS